VSDENFEDRGPRRRNDRKFTVIRQGKAGEEDEILDVDMSEIRPWMEPDPKWEDPIRELWDAFQESPQTVLFQPSDWAVLKLKATAWDMHFKSHFVGIGPEGQKLFAKVPPAPALLADMSKTLNDLMATEGGRRTAKIQLKQIDEGPKQIKDEQKIIRPVRQISREA
jgi:hypothetical protein